MDFIVTMAGMFALLFLVFLLACYDPIWGERTSLRDGFVFLLGEDV